MRSPWNRPHLLDSMEQPEPHAGQQATPRLLCDEWDAMRECYEILRRYDEAARRRIQEAVNARLGDDAARAAHQD